MARISRVSGSAEEDAYADFIRRMEAELDAREEEFHADQDAELHIAGAAPGYTLLAEGDSWFDYPAIGISDVIDHLRDLLPARRILNLAHWGHEAMQMMGLTQHKRLVRCLEDSRHEFHALLFSAGGNDIVGEPFLLWIRQKEKSMTPEEAIDDERLDRALAYVRIGYEEFLALRDEHRPNVPVFLHGYDFAWPTGRGYCPGVGPWLHPGLESRGWDDLNEGHAVVQRVLRRFDRMLKDLAAAHQHVHVVPTQGMLRSPNDWHNELHPNNIPFRNIANAFANAIRTAVQLP